MTVLDAPGPDDLERAVMLPDRKVETIDPVAPLDLIEQPWRMTAERGCAIEDPGHVGEKTVDARHHEVSDTPARL